MTAPTWYVNNSDIALAGIMINVCYLYTVVTNMLLQPGEISI